MYQYYSIKAERFERDFGEAQKAAQITPLPSISSSWAYHTANCPGVIPLCGWSKSTYIAFSLITSVASCNGCR